jgi:hypothetical protein
VLSQCASERERRYAIRDELAALDRPRPTLLQSPGLMPPSADRPLHASTDSAGSNSRKLGTPPKVHARRWPVAEPSRTSPESSGLVLG